ncbi:hypothetical protein [Paenibacillus pini]|nr:hypothetical protein [Paenibacillus pini]
MEAILKKKVASALLIDVANTTKNTMKEKMDDEVYIPYTPKMYEREKSHGGLTDDRNILVNLINETTLSVESHRMDEERNVSEIVESGKGYQYDFPFNGVPRPFTEATREELLNTGIHTASLYRGLKRQGLTVEVK